MWSLHLADCIFIFFSVFDILSMSSSSSSWICASARRNSVFLRESTVQYLRLPTMQPSPPPSHGAPQLPGARTQLREQICTWLSSGIIPALFFTSLDRFSCVKLDTVDIDHVYTTHTRNRALLRARTRDSGSNSCSVSTSREASRHRSGERRVSQNEAEDNMSG